MKMKQYITKEEIALITTEKVTLSFKNENCYLVARLQELKHDSARKVKRYLVRTDLASYSSIPTSSVNDKGEVTQVEKLILEIIEVKQDWLEIKFPFALIDQFGEQLKPMIPNGLTETELEKWKITQMFLIKRKQDAPWGVTADKWRVLLPEDLLKDKPNA